MTTPSQALEKLLGSLGESSHFVSSGSLTPVLPGLDVKDVGLIGLPVSATDAQRLIAKATQAPYGRGEATIVDTNVRRVWQLDPSQFVLRNSDWEPHVASIVDAVKHEFGLQEQVTAQLYKLLVYEEGSFFAPHRDTEKTRGMFATLVVCLPSRHKGGALVVAHDGQTKTIDFGGKDSEFKTQYAAFYADCQHEITPVSEGYRVCLVYNLATEGKKKQPHAPQSAAAVEKASQLLQELFADEDGGLKRIVIPFEHLYTQSSLDPGHLKGGDRTRLDVLARASEALDYQCYLALLECCQSGEVDYDTWGHDDYWSRGSRSWSHDEEEEDEDGEDDEGDDSGADMGEVYDEELTLDQWLDPRGRKQPFGEMHIEESEILSEEGKERGLVRQEVHEATGNEGVTMDRWYRQGVVVIWPRDRYFSILAAEGPATALPALEEMVGRGKKPAAREDRRIFAEAIVAHWQPRMWAGSDPSLPGRMLTLLELLGDLDLALRFLREVFPDDYSGAEGKALHRLCQRLGWEALGPAIRDFLAHQKPEDHYRQLPNVVSVIKPLCCDPPTMTAERRAVCASLAKSLMKVIERWDAAPADAWHRIGENRKGVVESVFRILGTLEATEPLEQFLARILADRRRYSLHGTLIPDVKAMAKWVRKVPAAQPAQSRLLSYCLAELRAATAQPVEPPKDWTRPAELRCGCADCRALGQFLRDPGQQVGRFPLRKERRQHLHQEIDAQGLDVTHVTQRVGSPQTLVCTKTQGSYERRRHQYEVDTQLLAELEAMDRAAAPAAVKRSSRPRKPKK